MTTYYICYRCGNIIEARKPRLGKRRRCSKCGAYGDNLVCTIHLKEVIRYSIKLFEDGKLDQTGAPQKVEAPDPIISPISEAKHNRIKIPEVILQDWEKFDRSKYSPVSNRMWLTSRYKHNKFKFSWTRDIIDQIMEAILTGSESFEL